jgi:Na+-driven multidrug efflux pump
MACSTRAKAASVVASPLLVALLIGVLGFFLIVLVLQFLKTLNSDSSKVYEFSKAITSVGRVGGYGLQDEVRYF